MNNLRLHRDWFEVDGADDRFYAGVLGLSGAGRQVLTPLVARVTSSPNSVIQSDSESTNVALPDIF